MEIKILQGANLKNDITTIIAEFDATPDTSLIEDIKNIHKIMMLSYSVDGNTVEVQSKMPHFWRETFKVLNDMYTGEKTEQEVKEYIYEVLLKQYVGSMSSIAMIEAVQDLNMEMIPAYKYMGVDTRSGELSWNKRFSIGVGKETELFKNTSSSGDTFIGIKVQRDKVKANEQVDRLQLPIAKWDKIESVEQLEEIFPQYPKPVVIKPAGLTQGNGVVTKITNLAQAIDAYDYAYETIHKYPFRPKWQHQIIIQQQVEGDDYRMLVVDGRLQIATLRVPAFVVGDGKSTIEDLVNETNEDPRRDLSDPTHILKPIVIDEMMKTYLSEQEISLDYVPKKKEQVFVRKVASMSKGGTTEDVTDKVHPQIRYLVESLAATSKLFVAGVDVMCKDISKPLTVDNGSFIEMNSMPEAFLNAFPTKGKQYPEIGKTIIQRLLKHKEPTTRVVVLGGDVKQAEAKLKKTGLSYKKDRVGVYSEGSLYINGHLMNSGIETWKAVEALKVNSILDGIILHYPTLDEVTESGFGFDKIDYVINNGFKSIEPRLKELKKKKLINKIIK